VLKKANREMGWEYKSPGSGGVARPSSRITMSTIWTSGIICSADMVVFLDLLVLLLSGDLVVNSLIFVSLILEKNHT